MCVYIIAIKEPDHESVQRLFCHQKNIKSNVGVAHIPIQYAVLYTIIRTPTHGSTHAVGCIIFPKTLLCGRV